MSLYIFEFEAYLYSYQQIFQSLISTQHNINTCVNIVLLFLAGLLASLNPCMLSMFPISIACVSGHKKSNQNIWNFIFGLYTSVFSGFSLTLFFNYRYHYILVKLPLIVSVFIIVLGLNLLNIFTIDFKILNVKLSQVSNHQDYWMGFLFGLNSSSCSTPILLTVFLWKSHLHKIFNIFIYMLGYTLPIISILFLSWRYLNLDKIMYLWKFFIPFIGSIVLCFGILKLLNNFSL